MSILFSSVETVPIGFVINFPGDMGLGLRNKMRNIPLTATVAAASLSVLYSQPGTR